MAVERRRIGLLLLTLFAGGAQAAPSAADAASDWLERMNRAVRQLDYAGRFVYQHRDHLEALYIRHTAGDGDERERLVSLNGRPRQVVRENDMVTCVVPRADKLSIDRRAAGRSISPVLPIRPQALAEHYRFAVGEQTRVAGRTAQVIEILPRDALRYGYRLALDLEHALPLHTSMIDSAGQLISQIMFTDLQVGQMDEDPGLLPLPQIASAAGEQAPRHGSRSHLMKPTAWRFESGPSGFMLNLHRRYAKADGSADVEHFVFSDGLATVSVYVEAGASAGLNGAAQAGPVNAYGRQVEGHQITLMGEVPLLTLQQLGEAIARVGPQP
ncbi:MAG: hypothetical protein RLZ44_523 [Pseudomonadota bacterium]|jgi:sigma-E factor negative regulatory protein RseB